MAFLVALAAIVQIINGLPDLFDRSLPWLGGKVNLGDWAASVWQLIWVVPLALALLLLVAIYRATRITSVVPAPQTAVPRTPSNDIPYRATPRTESHRLPPAVIIKPEPHRASDTETFCAARAELIRTGERFYLGLFAVPINANPNDEGPWHERMRSWIRACRTHHQTFWTEHYDPHIRPRAQPTVPAWVGQRQDIALARLQWLKEYGWGCDE
jgi:hypothetical protein